MVRAWRIRECDLDENNWDDTPKENIDHLDLDILKKTTGVQCWQLNVDAYEEDGSLAKIQKERGYDYEDEIEISENKSPNFDAMMKKFSREHLHADEEIRFCLEGRGYFDVREALTDDWVRVEVVKGDLIVLPPGIYHRLVLDPAYKEIKLKRLFIGHPVWEAFNRPDADQMEVRKKYLERMEEITQN